MSKSGYPGVTAMTVFYELSNLNLGSSLPFGVLEDSVKSRLKEFLKDGRTRSVKHGINNLEKYGILSVKKGKYGELSYSLNFFLDEERTIFLYLLSAIEDLTDTIEIRGRNFDLPTPKDAEEAKKIEDIENKINSFFSGQLKDREIWDRGIAKFNPLEFIEIALLKYADSGFISNILKGIVETVFGIDKPPPDLSMSSFFERYFGKDYAKQRYYYSLPTIERTSQFLFFISEMVKEYTTKCLPESVRLDHNYHATSFVYAQLKLIARNAVDHWLDFRLKKTDGIPFSTSFEMERSFTSLVLSESRAKLPIGIIEKFNIR